MKANAESLEAVTHTHTHTHTYVYGTLVVIVLSLREASFGRIMAFVFATQKYKMDYQERDGPSFL